MTIKKKILFVIGRDEYVRNYLLTDAFSLLEKKHECFYIASELVTQRQSLIAKSTFLGVFPLKEQVIKRHQRMFDIMMWRYRKKSSSFYFRFLRYLMVDLLKWHNNLKDYFKNVTKFIYYNIKDPKCLFCILLGSKLIFPIYLRLRGNTIPVHHELSLQISKNSPDLLVFPSSAYDPMGNDVIRIGAALGIKTLFLVDNWDNLSSKSLFWIKPDFLGVWGEQSKKHAVQIHAFEETKIFTIGTPRFDHYFTCRTKPLPSHFSFRYILFTGCAIPFDEVSTLRILDQTFEKNKEVCDGIKIIYRPHPWRQRRIKEDLFKEDEFLHVVIDPQIKEAYYKTGGNNSSGSNFQPALGYYPSLLKNALFVIGPLTTMLIEALIFYKRIIAIAYDDGKHFTSPHNALKYYLHFEGIENIEGFKLCRSQAELGNIIVRMLVESKDIDKKKLDADLNYFLCNDEVSYPQRLNGLANKIFSL